MIKYPLSFQVSSSSTQGMQSLWHAQTPQHQVSLCIPPEFEGPGGAFSPEDLFALALTNCFVATFKVYAEKSKIVFADVSVNSVLTVDLDEQKKPVMDSILMQIKITGAQQPERVQTIADKVLKSGFILNSVKTKIHAEVIVE